MEAEQAERRVRHKQFIERELALGARVVQGGAYETTLVTGRPISHLLHFLIGLVFHIWWVVWLLLCVTGGERRWQIWTDEEGVTHRRDMSLGSDWLMPAFFLVIAIITYGLVLLAIFVWRTF